MSCSAASRAVPVSSPACLPLAEAGLLPSPGDNAAVALRRLEAGTVIRAEEGDPGFPLTHTVLEGHRFAVRPVAEGEALLSWGCSFGRALRDIAAGEYVCNQGMLDSLALRQLDFPLPEAANFAENYQPMIFEGKLTRVTEQVTAAAGEKTPCFQGYRRPGARGAGIRNYVVLLGVNAGVAGFVKELERRLKTAAAEFPAVDGIVAVAHTEGDVTELNNREFILRNLAGYVVHPHTGAVLLVDGGAGDAVTADDLTGWMRDNGYEAGEVRHAVFRVEENFTAALEKAAGVVRSWLPEVNAVDRVPVPVSALNIGLQCGGSDAFSGISANPLIGWIGREIIGHGGAANIAETDELIGAEAYMIEKARSPEVARKFLEIIATFRERAAWHGANAEGNPTGGNKFRGLYNIYLKSLGAAMKKHPEVRLDHAAGYSERMRERGFYFMDSPGNDLESVSGQVSAGCHVILFTTGNGSITNHPLAPTVKVVTTTRRFELLSRDMDINAGRYLDGTPMEELGREFWDYLLEVCGGRKTVGELAGHSQVQVWRNWRRTAPGPVEPASPVILPGRPHVVAAWEGALPEVSFPLVSRQERPAAESVGLIMPTSLCAGSVAGLAAERLTRRLGGLGGITRYLALPHTEGCCVSQNAERLYPRTVLGCVTHPSVARCLMLEHGCEVTHNDFMRGEFARAGLPEENFGWASIQMDGGIEKVMERIEAWFRASLERSPVTGTRRGGVADLRLGLMESGSGPRGARPLAGPLAAALGRAVRMTAGSGGTVVLPEHSALLKSPEFLAELGLRETPGPTLAYAQPVPVSAPGLHIMASPTVQWTEVLVGLAACGVQAVLAPSGGGAPGSGIPLVPVAQFTAEPEAGRQYAGDWDFLLEGPSSRWPEAVLQGAARVLTAGQSAARRLGNEVFQVSRGELAVTL